VNIVIKTKCSTQDLDGLLEKISEIRANLVKNYPDIVVNVEVEMG